MTTSGATRPTTYIARCPKCKWQRVYSGVRPIFGSPLDSEGVKNTCPECHNARLVIKKESVPK